MFGEVIGSGVDADRYTADSAWHYDAGGADAQGVKFAFYLQPVRADTGALRVIPGSHRREWFDELYEYEPIGPRWTRAAASPEETQLAMDGIDAIPAYACESDPGDVVAFDLRIYHASLGGSNDRHMCSLVYYKYPSTPEELELITLNVKGHMARARQCWRPMEPALRRRGLDGQPAGKPETEAMDRPAPRVEQDAPPARTGSKRSP